MRSGGDSSSGDDAVRVVAPGGAIAERYRLTSPLGAGASAMVWAAVDETLGRPVALKLLSGAAAFDEDERARMRSEARALAALAHPHVVTVFDYLETPGLDGAMQPVLVTELLEGRSLRDRLAEGPLPWGEALSVCGQLAGALAAVHRAGIVHRDVTPANVVLTEAGAKLVDFGISQRPAERGTEEGLAVGTPMCMAPEQLTGQGALPASDVYALGCVLHWCLTGQPPYPAEDIVALRGSHLYGETPALNVAGFPSGVDELRRAALAKDPSRRPSAIRIWRALNPYAQAGVEARSGAHDETQALAVPVSVPVPARRRRGNRVAAVAGVVPAAGVAAGDGGGVNNGGANDGSAVSAAPRTATRHAGRPVWRDRRRVLPAGLLLIALALAVGGAAILSLAHAGTDTTANKGTGIGTGTGAGGNGRVGASPTPTSVPASPGGATASANAAMPSSSAIGVALPWMSASASPTTYMSTLPAPLAMSGAITAPSVIPALPNPAADPLGYLTGMQAQIQTLVGQGVAVLQPNTGQELSNSIAQLQSDLAVARQNNGKKQARVLSGTLAAIEQQISNDAAGGQISAAAANLLTGELQQLAAQVPALRG